MMNLRPTRDNLLIRRHDAEDRSAGGLYIPDNAKDKPHRGTVVAVGKGYTNEHGTFIPTECKVDDVVLFGAGYGAEVQVDGEVLILLGESAVLAVIA